jgi:hypothetical protein
MPWIVVGDFNEIVDNSEKVGGDSRPEQQMEGFRGAIRDFNLGDLGYKGSKFMSCNKREQGIFVKERLDRGLASPEWCSLFPNAGIEVEATFCSDHLPLWLRFDYCYRTPHKLFRYEACWNATDDCEELIRQAWARETYGSNGVEETRKKLLNCQSALMEWSKYKRKREQQSLNKLYGRLEKLQLDEQPGNMAEISQIQAEINKLLEMEDLSWR